MKEINGENLDLIMGGTTTNISGPIINAFVNIIKLLMDSGEVLGDGIRRISENKICPLK